MSISKYLKTETGLLTAFMMITLSACNLNNAGKEVGVGDNTAKTERLKKQIKHVIVVYEENWSFDGLFGDFPGANNLSHAVNTTQVDRNGNVLFNAPAPYSSTYANPPVCDTNFSGIVLPAAPYDLLKYIKNPSVKTGDLRHLFYSEQLQIDGGKMDKFIQYSDNGGLTMSYINLHDERRLLDTLEWKLASEYTLCDNFFHSAFGGSFLNHIWLVAAATPVWNNAPCDLISQPNPDKPNFRDNQLTPDGYVVNTTYSVNTPHPKSNYLMPYQQMPTIADRLIDANVSWAWYSGGWDSAASYPNQSYKDFQYHHQPLLYFETFKDGSANKQKYIRDDKHFFSELNTDSLPAVCFVKPYGALNEHPGYSDLWSGMVYLDSLVNAVMKSKYADSTAIIILSDENGGRWDHVSPPKIDRWGPGTRIPAIIVSKYAHKHHVDHTQYETVSVLKFIETLFGLKPLTNRDANANNLLNAFE